LDKTRAADHEWRDRQNELNESLVQSGKAFWPTIQLVAGKKVSVGVVPFQRRVVVQLEKHTKVETKDAKGFSREINDKTAVVTLELNEWKAFLEQIPMLKEFIKIAENPGDSEAVLNFLKSQLGDDNLYDLGKFGQHSEANIVKYRLPGKMIVMLFVWAERDGSKAPNCTVALGRGFVCKQTAKMLSRGNQTVYLSGAALDYLFTETLDLIENSARAWQDMTRFSAKLIYACKKDFDPVDVDSSLFKEDDVSRQIPVQEERLMDEMVESD
jgi:hypothetical protein